MDELIHKYEEILQRIYDKQTAGDHTFTGVLGDFLRDVERKQAIPHNRECRIYGHALVTLGTPEACEALEKTMIFKT